MHRSHSSLPKPDDILADVLRLLPSQQVKLASRLLAHVEREGDRDAKAAFRATLLRRRHEMKTGKVKGITIDQLMKALRKQASKPR